jgi:hypothetical protein
MAVYVWRWYAQWFGDYVGKEILRIKRHTLRSILAFLLSRQTTAIP